MGKKVKVLSSAEYAKKRVAKISADLESLRDRKRGKKPPLSISVWKGKPFQTVEPTKSKFQVKVAEPEPKHFDGLTTQGFDRIFPIYDGSLAFNAWSGASICVAACNYLVGTGIESLLQIHDVLPLTNDRMLMCLAHEAGAICPPEHYFFGKTKPDLSSSDLDDIVNEAAVHECRWWNTTDNRIYCLATISVSGVANWVPMENPDVPFFIYNEGQKRSVGMIFEQGMSILDFLDVDINEVEDRYKIDKVKESEKITSDEYRRFMDSLPE